MPSSSSNATVEERVQGDPWVTSFVFISSRGFNKFNLGDSHFFDSAGSRVGVKQDDVKCSILHFYQPPALRMKIFCTVCSSHLPGTKILVCLESEQTCQSPAAVAFSREQNPLWPPAFLKEMFSREWQQPQIQGLGERQGKTEHHLLPAAHSLLSRGSSGKMAVQILLAPLPPQFYRGHLSSFLQYLQELKHSCVCPGVGSAGEEGRAEAVPGGWAAPAAEHRGRTQDTPECPLDHGRQQITAPFLSSLLSTSHSLLFLYQLLWAETQTDPACLKAQTSETIYIFTPSRRAQTYLAPYAHLCHGHCDILAQKKIKANMWWCFMHHIMIFFFLTIPP